VTYVQRRLEPSLSYRYACRVGMCGSCAMSVNGVPRWTCRTHVSKVVDGTRLEIGPLANLPVIKDLATDMTAFFDKWARAKGQFKGSKTRHDDFARIEPESKARRAADAGIECIGCGVCYAACDVVTWRPAFLGPAALNRAWTLVNDGRDVGQQDRLRAVAGDAGCHSCHTQGSCTERCPKQIAPTAVISVRMARWSARISASSAFVAALNGLSLGLNSSLSCLSVTTVHPAISATWLARRPKVIDFSCGFHENLSSGTRSSIARVLAIS